MKMKLSLIGVIASLALAVAFAYAQQSSNQQTDPGMQSQSGSQMQQQSAITQDKQTVKQVQQALSNQGYYKGKADGKWSSKTQGALKKFQKAQGMQPTGELDQQTMAALGVTPSGSASGGAGGQQGGMSGSQSGAGGQQSDMSNQPSSQGGSKY